MQLSLRRNLSVGLVLLSFLVAGCNRIGTSDDPTDDTGETDEPVCQTAAPLAAVGQAVMSTCGDRWSCDPEQEGDYHRFYNECSRELLKVVRDCHRAEELVACAEVTGRCAKYEAESCARAFALCEE